MTELRPSFPFGKNMPQNEMIMHNFLADLFSKFQCKSLVKEIKTVLTSYEFQKNFLQTAMIYFVNFWSTLEE